MAKNLRILHDLDKHKSKEFIDRGTPSCTCMYIRLESEFCVLEIAKFAYYTQIFNVPQFKQIIGFNRAKQINNIVCFCILMAHVFQAHLIL